MSGTLQFIVELVKASLWPIATIVLAFKLYKPILAFLERAKTASAKIGAFTFEFTGGGSPTALPIAAFRDEGGRALVLDALRDVDPSTLDSSTPWKPDDLNRLPAEDAFKIMVALLETGFYRLEFMIGLPQKTYQRNVTLRSDNFRPFLDNSSITVYGYYESDGTIHVAGLLYDIPELCGPFEILNYTGALVGALQLAFGTERKWELVVGVIPGRDDSAERVERVQERFAPSAKSGRVRVIHLDHSFSMNHIVSGLINEALSNLPPPTAEGPLQS